MTAKKPSVQRRRKVKSPTAEELATIDDRFATFAELKDAYESSGGVLITHPFKQRAHHGGLLGVYALGMAHAVEIAKGKR